MAKWKYTEKDILRRLGELAFGRANDVIKLAFLDAESVNSELDKLDLTLLSEFKRSSSGVVEVKLANRLDALAKLSELTGTDSAAHTDGAESFLRAMDDAARHFGGGE